MNLRTIAAALVAIGLAALSFAPAHAAARSDLTRTAHSFAAPANPCDLQPQSGGGVEKISGPGPDFDRGYSVVGTPRDGSCLKVSRPTQDGKVSHTVEIRSAGHVQMRRYDAGHSNTRMAHDASTKCRVTVRVRIVHDNGRVGIYGADQVISHCGLFS
jgi:hypothetical protein